VLAYMPPLQFPDLIATFERVSDDPDRFRVEVLEIWKTIQQSYADLPKFIGDGAVLDAERREHRYYVHWLLDHLIDRTRDDKLGPWLTRTPRGWAAHAEVLLSSELVPELIALAGPGVKLGGPHIQEIWETPSDNWRVVIASDDVLWKQWLSLRLERQVGRAARLHVLGERDLVRIAVITAGVGAAVMTTAWLIHRQNRRPTYALEGAGEE
jgi:hypothetical protein